MLRTVVLTDAAGFTASMRENEPEALRQLATHLEIIKTELEKQGGAIVKCTGDGYLAVFESAVSAVVACREAQKLLLEHPLRPRMGVHAGEVTLTSDDAFGDAVNICARLEQMGHPGEIVLSGTINDLLVSQSIDKPRYAGTQSFKGISDPIAVFTWQYGEAPKRKRPFNYAAIFATLTLIICFATLSWKALSNNDSKPEQSTQRILDDLKSRKANREPQYSNGDIDLIMDEAYAQVLDELDALNEAKSLAIEKLDATIVLKWLKENPYGQRERGQLETEHWTLVDIAIKQAKKKLGNVASPQEVVQALGKSADQADKLALKAFEEEFTSEGAK